MRLFPLFLMTALAPGTAGVARAADDQPAAPPVGATRAGMKELLERAKAGSPRLPLPPPTEEEKAASGGRAVVINGRARQLYLPAELRGGDFVREPDPAMSLDSTFKTMLFWVVSRANNCTYCLGHQEIKLASDGLSDDRIAALDGDWKRFTPAEQAALRLTRRLTHEPHKVNDEDVALARKHFTEPQTLEIIYTVANNNATNRWTGGLRLPPEQDGSALTRLLGKGKGDFRTFLTPTSPEYRDFRSEVAPLQPLPRPPLEDRARAEAALAACRTRTPRFALVEEADARKLLPEDLVKGPLPEWVRLLATFPVHGRARVLTLHAAEQKGHLKPLLKAQVAWLCARQDRAWYAAGVARKRLNALGLSDDAVFALDGPADAQTPAERAAFQLARRLTAAAHAVTDEDFAAVRKHYSDHEAAELVYHVANAAFFDRVTEAAALRIEER